MLRTIVSCMILSIFLAGCSPKTAVLPHTLYYLDGSGETAQVWRLDKDGITRHQVSNELSGVQDFAISPKDGSLALVSDNQLILTDAKGSKRQLIVEGGHEKSLQTQYLNTVSSPAFSPDEKTLAYAMNGVHLYDLATGKDEHVLTNPEKETFDALSVSTGIYRPVSWSPSGRQLLVTMSYYEGYQLVVLEPGLGEEPLRLTPADYAVCCQFSWTADGKSILAATPFFTGTIPGLWRFDAQTGKQTLFLTGEDAEGTTIFYGWPYQSAMGELTLFYDSQEDFPSGEKILFSLVRVTEEGNEPKKLRDETLSMVSALWYPKGEAVIILGSWDGGEKQLAIFPPGAGEIKVLIDQAPRVGKITWGP